MHAPAPRLAPLDYGGILDRAFDLYRENFRLFVAIAAIFDVPLTLLQVWTGEGLRRAMSGDPTHMASALAVYYASFLLLLAGAAYVHAALAMAISNRYLELPASLSTSYASVARAFVPLTLTMILCGLLVSIGMVLCLVPGLVFAFWVAFIVPVAMVERSFYGAAIARSKWLIAEGQWVRVMVLGILVLLLVAGLSWATTFAVELGARAAHLGTWPRFAWAAILSPLLAPFGHIVNMILYYDIRVRKEAFDLQLLAASLGVSAPAPAPIAPAMPGLIDCPHCGRDLPADAAFCAFCGNAVRRVP